MGEIVRKSDRPILFSAPMVLALLREARQSGTGKTQTRQLMKPQPPTERQFPHSGFGMSRSVADGVKMYSQNDHPRLPKHPTDWDLIGSVGVARDAGFPTRYRLPYAGGDRLWVRETWADVNTDSGPAIAFRAGGLRWCSEDAYPVEYDRYPDCQFSMWCGDLQRGEPGHAWRRSTAMPRWASRLTLLVTEVRVERLNDISEGDAVAEGVEHDSDGWKDYLMPSTQCCGSAAESFRTLWDSLHGPDAWTANPWVCAVSFRPVEANIDTVPDAIPEVSHA